MSRPRLFVSAVSSEFGSLRKEVEEVARRIGFDPVSQDNFGYGNGELLNWLKLQIDSCESLVQLVGKAYGAEPERVTSEFGRVSYTQFEFLYADQQGKKTWIIIVGDGCDRDRPVEALDLPATAHPDPRAYQAERRVLQAGYIDRINARNHVWHTATNRDELKDIIAELRSAVAETIQALKRSSRRREVFAGLIAAMVLTILVVLGLSWQREAERAERQRALERQQAERDQAALGNPQLLGWTVLEAARRQPSAVADPAAVRPAGWLVAGRLFLNGEPSRPSEFRLLAYFDRAGSSVVVDLRDSMNDAAAALSHPVRLLLPAAVPAFSLCLTRRHPVTGTPYQVRQDFVLDLAADSDAAVVAIQELPRRRAAPEGELNCESNGN